MQKAVVLFSGGLDSTTCLGLAKSAGYECYALSFNYGQKHHAELQAAEQITAAMAIKHLVINLPIAQFGGSALTDQAIDIPDYQHSTSIPITYVPARNTIFLAYALSWAEVLQAKHIFIGVSHIDYSGYPDCRPEFIQAFQQVANLGTKIGIEEGDIQIHTPLIYLSKAETIRLGMQLGVNYRLTISCYRVSANGRACGDCDSCVLRKKGFTEAGIEDPTIY